MQVFILLFILCSNWSKRLGTCVLVKMSSKYVYKKQILKSHCMQDGPCLLLFLSHIFFQVCILQHNVHTKKSRPFLKLEMHLSACNDYFFKGDAVGKFLRAFIRIHVARCCSKFLVFCPGNHCDVICILLGSIQLSHQRQEKKAGLCLFLCITVFT